MSFNVFRDGFNVVRCIGEFCAAYAQFAASERTPRDSRADGEDHEPREESLSFDAGRRTEQPAAATKSPAVSLCELSGFIVRFVIKILFYFIRY